MPLYLLAILALVQGITEFLPISSSGHLGLTWIGFHWAGLVPAELEASSELVLDIAVHLGTLGAVCLYCRRDLAAMAGAMMRPLAVRCSGNPMHWRPAARLCWLICLATLPILAAGYLAGEALPLLKGNLALIGWTTLGFGLLLWIADRNGMTGRKAAQLKLHHALFLGLAQCLALVPGTSRSGIVMTAGRFLGMGRQDAARFSMLMSIPTILAAGLYAAMQLKEEESADLGIDAAIAAGLAFAAALLAIALMMAWLRRASFLPFVLYRVLLGGAILLSVYGGFLTGWA
ncbi:MAG: undecaprenyl-diphosphate phosphatase [Rhodospirillales bacterium]|nr:undecaprenyl-diphosphate phosphatase [Rhodospirillales bacterium]